MGPLGPGPVALDTSIFIYFIEEHPTYLPRVLPLFRAAEQGVLTIVTSALTLLEVLVVPYRRGSDALAQRYEELLTRSCSVRLVEIGRDQLRIAARLRATTGVRTPDALQLSAALAAGCSAFFTNDRRLPAVPGLRIVTLS